MRKPSIISLLLFILMSTANVKAISDYDLAVEYTDGKTIYYNYTHEGEELAVTCLNDVAPFNEHAYEGNVVIPDEVKCNDKTLKVTSIGEFAFAGCSALSAVTIPNSVTEIGQMAFQSCKNLSSLNIPNRLASIGMLAFWECSSLTTVVIPGSVTSIGGGAFYDCSSLESVTIEYGVTCIEEDVFQGCKRLLSLTIPNSVTTIKQGAFCNCEALTSISISESVTIIDNHVFQGCSSLKSLIIPNSVTKIEAYAFNGCESITSIIIPDKVTEICRYAFLDCRNLKFVKIGSSVKDISVCAFDGCPNISTIVSLIENPCFITESSSNNRTFDTNTFNNATLYVPVGSKDKYKSTIGWNDFVTIVEGDGSGSSGVEQEIEKPLQMEFHGNVLTAKGINNSEQIFVYSTNGMLVGKSTSENGVAKVNTHLEHGAVAIVKIRDKIVKMVVK